MAFLYRISLNLASTVDIKEGKCFFKMTVVVAIWALFRFRVCICLCNVAISSGVAAPKSNLDICPMKSNIRRLCQDKPI